MNLLYGNGEVVLEGNTDVVGLQIHFMGKINIESKLPDNFNIVLANGKMLIYSMDLSIIPNMLFTYNGAMRITQCIASDNQGKGVTISSINNNLGFWTKTNGTWDTGSDWDSYSGSYKVGNKVLRQKNNIPKIEKGAKKVKQKTRSGGGY